MGTSGSTRVAICPKDRFPSFVGYSFFTCRAKTPAYVDRMEEKQPDEEEILEIVDQRRPVSHPAKYLVFGVVALVFILCGYRLLSHFTPGEVVGAATAPLEKSVALTGRFLQHVGNFLTTSHISTSSELEIGRVTATDKLGPLIVAKQDINLKFTNIDEHIFGTSTTEVRALGKAIYYVPLLGPQATWKLEALEKDGAHVCVVHAPTLRVLLPVNVDTRSLEIRTTTGALRSNEQEMTGAALADITPRLNREALAHEATVRGAARQTIAAFVKSWLETDANWGPGRMTAIQVLFPGETTADTAFAIPASNDRR
jgi:hypothetical protein